MNKDNNKMGLGSLSLLICITGIFYSLIFFIPSVIVGYKFKNNLGATIGKIVSSIIVILILVSIPGLTV
ncbi:hypothetical protein [Clostridium sp.]|uniref:hypothetical protein n=1 Tax=Clostridium sp. TaxID=1506 RepID=UPI003F4AFAAF